MANMKEIKRALKIRNLIIIKLFYYIAFQDIQHQKMK